MGIVKLTPKQIALVQLELALDLYLSGRNLVSAVTLAGAAEEILGEFLRRRKKVPSLLRRAEGKRALFRLLWPARADPGIKPFITLSNDTRNVMKHLRTTKPLQIDLEAEAGRLLTRAVENYAILYGPETAKMRRFQRKRLGQYRLLGVS